MPIEPATATRRFRDLLNDLIALVEDAWADGTLQWSCADYARIMDRIAPEMFDVTPGEVRRQADVAREIQLEHRTARQ